MDVDIRRASDPKLPSRLGHLGNVSVSHQEHRSDIMANGQWPWFRYFSYDAITAVSFGEPLGFLDARRDIKGLIGNMEKAMYVVKMSLYPTVSWFARNNPLGRWIFVSQRTDKKGLGLFMAVGIYLPVPLPLHGLTLQL